MINPADSSNTQANTHKTSKKDPESNGLRFRILFENSRDANLIIEDNLFVDCNDATVRMLGYKTKEDILNVHPSELSPKYQADGQSSVDKEKEMIAFALTKGSHRFEWEHRKSNGEVFPVEVLLTMIPTGDKTIIHVIWRDLTESKESELALLESETYNKILFRDSGIPLLVMDSKTFKYIDCNQAAVDIYGFKDREETLRKTPIDCSAPTQYNGEESSAAAVKLIAEALEKGSVMFEWRHQRPNGEIWDGEVKLMKFVYRDSTLLQLSLLDITERKRAEEALISSKHFAENLIETAHTIVVTLDINAKINTFNKYAEELTGYKKAEVLGRNWFELFIPEEFKHTVPTVFKEALNNMSAGGQYENPIMIKSGEERLISWSNNVLRDNSNVVTGVLSIGLDITEQKETEEALRFSEDKYSKTFFLSPDAISISSLSTGILFETNKGFELLFGYGRDATIGKSTLSLNIWTDLSDREKMIHLIRNKGRVKNFEAVGKTKSGRKFIGDISSEIIEISGEKCLLTIVRDITEQKEAEKALKKSEKRFRDLAEMLPVAIFETDKKLNIKYANKFAFELFGYTHQDIISGLKGMDMLAPEDRAKAVINIARRFRGGDYKEREFKVLRKDGHKFYVLFHIAAIISEGQTIGYRGTLVDISDIKRAEKEILNLNKGLETKVKLRTSDLENANNELNDFAYIVSHDLKAPLRGIAQLSSWLKTDYQDTIDEQGRETLDLLTGRVVRMNNLIDAILNYSRIGRKNENDRLTDLNKSVDNVLQMLSASDSISISVDNDLPKLIIDPVRIEQVFQNLISNAVEYMDKPEGIINISSEDQGTYYLFKVKDNGPGIDAKYHKKIFEIFQTLQSKDESESTGIGLSTVKKIVKYYKGGIWLESAVGEGATFCFTLPKTN
ncbi:MAG: PAS domain S-box protein [Chlorobi bacterium]|nr:PAS domain S-box protein [Chlorobiota bacterium]